MEVDVERMESNCGCSAVVIVVLKFGLMISGDATRKV